MPEPFKYLIQPVAIERDENGQVRREIPGEVLSVYSLEQAVEAITTFEEQLKKLSERSENGNRIDDRDRDNVRQSELSREQA